MRFAVFGIRRNRTLILSRVALVLVFAFVTKPSSSQDNHVSGSVLLKPALTPHDELYAVHINPSGSGWAVGKFGRILHTSDAGKNWAEQNSGTRKPLTSVSFSDEFHGFAVGGGGAILATADGGRSWQPRQSPVREHLLDVDALNAGTVFAVGGFGTFLSTNNGGAAWLRHRLTWTRLVPRLIREAGAVEPNLNTVYFIDHKEGWLGGEFGLLLHTQDGGQTWSAKRFGADLPQIVSIRFSDRLAGWAVGSRGTLLNTIDGGRTWRQLDTGTERDFYALWVEGQKGVIVGQGVILKTANGGLEWVNADLPFSSFWLSGVAGKGNAAVAVGQAGTIRMIEFRE